MEEYKTDQARQTAKGILVILLLILGFGIGYAFAKVNEGSRLVKISCRTNETPVVCQQRLGDQFEVIYSPYTKETWAEYTK